MVPLIVAVTAVAAYTAKPMEAPDLMPVKMQAAPKHTPVELVRGGQSQAVVYVACPVTPALKTLVAELIDVVKLSTAADQAAIVIGDCPESRAAGIDAAKLRVEGFAVKTAKSRIHLVHDGSLVAFEQQGQRIILKNLPPKSPDITLGIAVIEIEFKEKPVFHRCSYYPQLHGGKDRANGQRL